MGGGASASSLNEALHLLSSYLPKKLNNLSSLWKLFLILVVASYNPSFVTFSTQGPHEMPATMISCPLWIHRDDCLSI